MTLLVDLEQAVADALTAWLVSQLPGVKVSHRWPDPDTKLSSSAVTILRVGGPDYEDCDPVVVKSTPPSSGNNGSYVWRYATCSLAFQLDVWCTTKPDRSDLLAKLRTALTASKSATLSGAFLTAAGAGIQDPIEQAIYLQLAAPWDHIVAEYAFERPQFTDTADSVQRREYRATCEGTAFYDATETRTSPQLNSVIVAQYATTNPNLTMPSPTTTNELTTITATTITHTRGPRPT